MNKTLRRSLVLAGLAVLALSALAFAHGGYGMSGYGHGYGYGMMDGYGPGYGSGYGPGYDMMGGYGHMGYGWGGQNAAAALTPEQQEAYQGLAKEHYEHMTALQNEAIAQQNRLAAATTAQDAAKARDALTDVANRMSQERADFQGKVQERFGITDVAYGPGWGCPGWNASW